MSTCRVARAHTTIRRNLDLAAMVLCLGGHAPPVSCQTLCKVGMPRRDAPKGSVAGCFKIAQKGLGQKPVPPVNIPIQPLKWVLKWVADSPKTPKTPKMGSQNGFDPQPCVNFGSGDPSKLRVLLPRSKAQKGQQRPKALRQERCSQRRVAEETGQRQDADFLGLHKTPAAREEAFLKGAWQRAVKVIASICPQNGGF